MFRRRRRENGTRATEAPEQTYEATAETYEAPDETHRAPESAEPNADYADAGDSLPYDAEFDAEFDAADDAGLGYDATAEEADDGDAGGGAHDGDAGGGAYAVDSPAETGSGRHDLSDPATWTRLRDTQPAAPAMARTCGPWDSAGEYPEQPRIDFGSLLVPVRDGYDIQVLMSEEEGVCVAVVHGDSGLQLQPFAAPRSSGLWQEVLPEIAQEVAKVGGQSVEQDGPFGPELLARVAPQGGGGQQNAPQPLRFIGVDGPRWFLRGLISGPAALDDDQARQFREVLADVVVVRGEQAQPPRQPLQIELPEEARQALEGQATAEQPKPFDPLERGEQITETR